VTTIFGLKQSICDIEMALAINLATKLFCEFVFYTVFNIDCIFI